MINVFRVFMNCQQIVPWQAQLMIYDYRAVLILAHQTNKAHYNAANKIHSHGD